MRDRQSAADVIEALEQDGSVYSLADPGSTVEHPDYGWGHVHGHFACVVFVEGFKGDRFSEAGGERWPL